MVGELSAVVSRDRAHRPKAAFAHESFDGCDDFVLRDRLDLLDERVAGLALREDEQPASPASRGVSTSVRVITTRTTTTAAMGVLFVLFVILRIQEEMTQVRLFLMRKMNRC